LIIADGPLLQAEAIVVSGASDRAARWSLSGGVTGRHLAVAAGACLFLEAALSALLSKMAVPALVPAGGVLCFLTMAALAARIYRTQRKAALQLVLYGFLLVNTSVIIRVLVSFVARSGA
jgi:hypothetical protein